MVDGEEPVLHLGHHGLTVLGVDLHLAGCEDGKSGRVTGQDAQLALGRARDDHSGRSRPDPSFRAHQFDLERHPFTSVPSATLAINSLTCTRVAVHVANTVVGYRPPGPRSRRSGGVLLDLRPLALDVIQTTAH